MPEFTQIVRTLSEEKFVEVFSASPRKAREICFQRHGIKKPKKTTRITRLGAGKGERAGMLFAALKAEEDDQMVEELLRTWLLTKRSLLAAALDHLEIAHDDGLTESEDISRFESLSAAEIKKMAKVLKDHGSTDEIAVYLKFMGAEGVDKALGL